VFASVTTFGVPPAARADAAAAAVPTVVAALLPEPGFLGAYWSPTPDGGQLVTLWRSEEELNAAERAAALADAETATMLGADIVAAESYEVPA
jgi:hypothetical protein